MRTFLLALAISLFTPVFANDSPQALQDAFVNALLAQDANAVAACYTDDAISYAIDTMVLVGPGAVRKSWQEFFSTYKVLAVELDNGDMLVKGKTAVSWGLFTITAEPVAGGEAIEMRGRYTDISKKIYGQWLYILDHASVPTTAE